MKVVSADEMRHLDEKAQQQYGLDSYTLMAEAGRAIALEIDKVYHPEHICIVCGKGNNAGDGFVAAREFYEMGRSVTVVCLEAEAAYYGSARTAWDRLLKTKVSLVRRDQLAAAINSADVIVDAILGTGMQGPAREHYARAIDQVNTASKPVIAVDVPSGLRDMAPGEETGSIVDAAITVTIGLPKSMLFTYPGITHTGRVVVCPINFPEPLLASDEWKLNWAPRSELASWLPERRLESNKGTHGNVGIIGSALSYAGATVLVARAALRAGCGLATIYTLAEANAIYKTALPEATSTILETESPGSFDTRSAEAFHNSHKSHSVLAVGPGLSTTPGTKDFLDRLLGTWEGPLIIDADGLNLLADGLLPKLKNRTDCLLTPHPGEMSRLTGLSVKEVQADRINVVRQFAIDNGVNVLLKGVGTLIARPDGQVWINPGAEAALAKGGTGDVLTGVIASLCAQGTSLWQAAVLAAWVHLQAGKKCAKRYGSRGVLASEVADMVPLALDELANG